MPLTIVAGRSVAYLEHTSREDMFSWRSLLVGTTVVTAEAEDSWTYSGLAAIPELFRKAIHPRCKVVSQPSLAD